MRVEQIPFDPTTVRAQADTTQDGRRLPPRSAGLHLSDIYKDLEETLGKKYREMGEEQRHSYFSIGYLFEHVVGLALGLALADATTVRPGEFNRDGITGSPDLVDLSNPDRWVVVETKATYLSYNKMGDDAKGLGGEFWAWKVQMAGYCYMVGTTDVRLKVVFLCGDYRPPRPLFRQWNITFSERELAENWSMIKSHARKRGWL